MDQLLPAHPRRHESIQFLENHRRVRPLHAPPHSVHQRYQALLPVLDLMDRRLRNDAIHPEE